MPSRTNAAIDASVFAAAERPLTRMQQRFVDAFLANGGRAGDAACAAGYAAASASTAAANLLRNPLIQREVVKGTLQAIGFAAVPAVGVVTRLMTAAKSDYVKLEAARDILDRAGYGVPQHSLQRDDQTLSVNIHLGGSKTHPSTSGTHPDTEKSSLELDLSLSATDSAMLLERAAAVEGDAADFGEKEP
jgi:Terminase small subunit